MTLPTHSALLPAVLLSVCALAAPALAQDVYRLEGAHQTRGAFTSQLEVVPRGEGFSVARRVRWADGSETLYVGEVEFEDGLLRGSLSESVGAAGRLEGREGESLSFALRPGERAVATTREASGATSEAAGVRYEDAESRAEAKQAERGLKGRLLGLARKEALDAVAKGAEFGTDLTEFAHVGVRVRVAEVPQASLTHEQEAARAAERSVWILSELEGGARIGTSQSVELGGASLGLGIRAGSQLSYRVVERYPLGANQSATSFVKEFAGRAKEAYSLPLSASEAGALSLGAERELEGSWQVLLSGNLSVGDPVEGQVSLGGSFQIRDRFRLRVQGLGGKRVRLSLLKARARALNLNARALLGVAVRERLEDALPSATFLAKPVAKEVERYLRVELSVGAGGSTERDVEVVYELDLDQAPAAQAYERAIRGDWRHMEGAGVRFTKRRVGLERARHTSVSLGISKLASYKSTTRTTRREDKIRDEEGLHTERSVRFQRGKQTSWFGADERYSLDLEGNWTPKLGGGKELTLRVRYAHKDERTSNREFNRLRGAFLATGLGQAAALQPTQGEVGCTLDLLIEPAGLSRAERTPREQVLQAYAAAVETIDGQRQLWRDPAQRTKVRLRRQSGKPGTHRPYAYPTERRHLQRAERFADALQTLAASRSPEEREDRFLTLAKSARWELYELSALTQLSGSGAAAYGVLGGHPFSTR